MAKWIGPALVLLSSLPWLAAASPVAQSGAAEVVTLDSGRVDGSRLSSGVKAWFGIPFAAPPVGKLRWREPQPVQPWTGTLHADRFAPECMQALRAHDINHYFGEEATSEDCLYLNVWAPAQASAAAPKPVVVWIYGGGFTIGSASMANYRGESLAKQGVVYVGIAYRLGALGFLAHPALTAESAHHASGNQGFLDQIAALKWVQQNIAKFGGDPRNVTIMGQSAGSMSVSLLQASPLAHGLFNRAIGMSGGSFGDGPGVPEPLKSAEQGGARLQQQLQAGSIEAMRSAPADRILQAQLATSLRYGPVVDGYFMPATPAEIFAARKQSDVPTLVGYTRDEAAHFGIGARGWAQAQSAHGKAPVYVYQFARVHPYAPGITFSDHDPKTVGAYHAGDVPYWLGTLDTLNLFRTTRNWTAYDRELADTMMGVIVSFATSGNPAAGKAAPWPEYRADNEQLRVFGDDTRVMPWPKPAAASAPNAADAPAIAASPVLEDRYPERRAQFPNGVVGFADVTYSTLNGYRPLVLDLYRPADLSQAHPLVIYVHGGGWQSGHTRHSGAFENWPGVLASIAARGYVVVSLEYRLSSEARFPAAIQDVKTATRWLRANASKYGIDPQRAVIWGGSAGGQLAALAGMSCGAKALEPPDAANGSDCVQGVVAWYGIFDFSTMPVTADSGPGRYLGCAQPKCASSQLGAASPSTYAGAGDPPVLLLHGVDDHTVPVKQSRDFLALLKAKGIRAELVEIPDVDHSFVGRSPEATRAASLQALQKTLEFIDNTLGQH